MSTKKTEIDITTNMRVVAWLKAELVEAVADLFKALLKASTELTADALATIIISSYLLGRRTGINFQAIDMLVRHKLNTSINEANEVEQWYGDLTELNHYLERKEQKKR